MKKLFTRCPDNPVMEIGDLPVDGSAVLNAGLRSRPFMDCASMRAAGV